MLYYILLLYLALQNNEQFRTIIIEGIKQNKIWGFDQSLWQKLDKQNLVECPHCHKLMQQHRVCPSCGYYDGTEVISMKAE